jgi:tRNA(fMet)-specific endonuclease VapC
LQQWLRSRRPEPVAISAITFSELWFGIEAEKNPARVRIRRRWLQRAFRNLEVVPFDTGLARIHSRVWAKLVRSGVNIGSHDLIIAATALHREWAVVTFNDKDFLRVPGLNVIKP